MVNLRNAFPDLLVRELAVITKDDTIIAIINMSGTHSGDFFTLTPLGNKVSNELVHIFKVGEDGMIVEHRTDLKLELDN